MSGQWTTQDYVYVTAECVTGVLSVFGNVLVLVAIMKSYSLRTVTNCFIGSLAAADTLVGLLIPPITILSYTGLPRHFHWCILVNTMVVLITNISILNLLAVALDRFLAVSRPFTYQRLMTVNRALMVVAFTWIVAILIGLIPVMGWHLDKEGFQTCAFIFVIDLKYMVYLVFFGVNVPLLIAMLVIYIYIFYVIYKQQQRTQELIRAVMSKDMRNNMRQRKNEVRGAKGLAYVIILFALCWLPLHIMNCVTVFAPKKSVPYSWLLVAIVLSHANSFINPFLYAFSNSRFKFAMKRLLCCGRGSKPYDYDSAAETSRLRSKRGTIDSEASAYRHSTEQEARQRDSTQANSEAPVSPASTPIWTSTSVANPSPSKQTVYNGNGTHAGTTLPELGHLNQHEVTDSNREDRHTVQFHHTNATSSTVIFPAGSDISHTVNSGSVWVSTSSKCARFPVMSLSTDSVSLPATTSSRGIGIEQQQYLEKTESNVDSVSQQRRYLAKKESSVDPVSQRKTGKKGRIAKNVLDRAKEESKQVSTDIQDTSHSSVGESSTGSSANINLFKSSNFLSVRL